MKTNIHMSLKNFKGFLSHLESIGFVFAQGGRFPSRRDIFINHANDLKITGKGLKHIFALPTFEEYEKFTILELHRKDGAVYFDENPHLNSAFALRPHTGGPYFEILVSVVSEVVSGWIDLRAKFLMESLEIRKPSERLRKTFKELGSLARSLDISRSTKRGRAPSEATSVSGRKKR